MSEEYYQKVFSRNLRHYMEENNKSQIDIINDLGFNKSAVSTWYNGTRLPRMDKVDALAKYFGVKRSNLIEDKVTDPTAPVPTTLLPDEASLIDDYRKLNSTGKEKASEYVSDLAEQDKYIKDTGIGRSVG